MPSINVDRGPPFNKVTARHTCSPVFHIFVPDCAGEKKNDFQTKAENYCIQNSSF